MLEIRFDGWFQCRLATNPDPSDEPRGVSGHTFALAGEPDLDRVIRFHEPVARRSHGPDVGVQVRRVLVDGVEASDHPLLGAAVDLLGDAKFESRNKLLGTDRGGAGIIHPFRLRISGGAVTLERADVLDPARPDEPPHRLSPSVLERRSPTSPEGFLFDPGRVARATGIADPTAYRAARRAALEADLERASDVDARAALEKRILELSIDDPRNIRTIFLGVSQAGAFDLNGPASLEDRGHALAAIDTERAWPIELWMGGWDADALCGFAEGTLKVLTRADPEPDAAS